MSAPTLSTGGLLAPRTAGLAEHRDGNGPIPWRGGGRLIADLEAAGLTGRGGAGFPAWRKAATTSVGGAPVVIGNGAEGEPLSRKDAELLRRNPHLVLDGLQLAAEAIGAADAFLYLPAGPGTDAVTTALRERSGCGWDRLAVRLVTAPDRFLAGEESAVIAAVEGRRPLPRFRTEPVARNGMRGRPTLVHNVETLAHIAQIARFGPGWFRGAGTREEPGTFLATVSGAVGRPGVFQVPIGIPLAGLLDRAGPVTGPRAVLIGGYHGIWLPATESAVPLSRAGLSGHGGSPGAGVVHVLGGDRCGLRCAAGVTGYLAEQGARQCGPCRNGLPALAGTLAALAEGRPDPGLPERVRVLSDLVTGRGACHHPDGVARFVRSTLVTFRSEVDAHLHGRCGSRT